MNADRLLALYEQVAEAPDAVPRLRRFVLDLAVRGNLVAQDASDEPASELLKRIAAEKVRLVNAGEIRKPRDLANGEELESPFDIPASWACVSLGRVLDFKYGKGMKASERLDDGPVPVFGSNGIVGYTTAPLTEEPAIIVGRKGSAGALNLCYGPSWTTDVAYYVEAPRFFSLRYLFLTLQALDLDTLGKGVKPGLSRADAYPLLLGIPPLAEQRRIVARVEELMALLDRLEAALATRDNHRARLLEALLLEAPDPAATPATEAAE